MGLRGPGARPKKPRNVDAVLPEAAVKWRETALPMWRRVVAFCNSLPITAGKLAGQTMRLRPWQVDFLKKVYMPRKKGRRVVRTAVLSLPRKQGKTALCAALALCHLSGPCAEQRGQVYSAASDRKQAALIFDEMVAIIDRVPWLGERLNIRSFNKRIEDMENGSVYEALSSDARKAHGLSPSFVVCDEIAQWRGRTLYDNLVSGMGAREQPLTVCIGTQSDCDDNLMSELVDYAEKVNTGEVVDPSFAGTVYAAPMESDPWDVETWKASNPALGDFKDMEDMRLQAEQAQRIPSRVGTFRNLQLNQRVSASPRFITLQDWQACYEPYEAADLYGRPCYGGLDLSATNDLTSLVLYFHEDGGRVLPFFWLPKDDVRELEDKSHVPYRQWARQGCLTLTPGRVVDYSFVAATLGGVLSDFNVVGIAFDRWRIKQLQQTLDKEGVTGVPLTEFGQGFKDMAPAVDAVERAVLAGKLRHNANPLLTWNMANVTTESDPAGNRKPCKRRGTEKIDGAVALMMAMGLAARAEEGKPKPNPDGVFFL